MKKEEIIKEYKNRWIKEVTGDWECEFIELLEEALTDIQREMIEEILKTLPLGKTSKLKVAETDYALKSLQKNQPDLQMQDIREHNIMADAYGQGYSDAVDKLIKWKDSLQSPVKEEEGNKCGCGYVYEDDPVDYSEHKIECDIARGIPPDYKG